MGGKDSGVCQETTEIIIESAVFSHTAMAHSLRRCSLHSDSSYRFERGVDPQLHERALALAADLLIQYAKAKPVSYQSESSKPVCQTIDIDHHDINQYLGVELSSEQITQYLNQLGMPTRYAAGRYHIEVPSHRYDIQIAEDVIEKWLECMAITTFLCKP